MTTAAKPATVKKIAAKKPATTSSRRAAPASRTAGKTKPSASKTRVAQPLKKDKPEKVRIVRDSYSLPEADYAKLIGLKKKCVAAGVHIKKSELLRLGLLQLSKLGNVALLAAAKRIASAKKKAAVK